MEILKGIPGSGGIAVGPVLLCEVKPFTLPDGPVPESGLAAQRQALAAAHRRVRADLANAAQKTAREIGKKEAEIFTAHISVLEDPEIIASVHAKMSDGHLSAAAAVWAAAQEVSALFAELDDAYMRARAADILDVAERVVRALTGEERPDLTHLAQPCILVGHDITPSDTVAMDKKNVLAIVSETGSATSHAVILARSLGIPAVVGVRGACAALAGGGEAVVDGAQGTVLAGPDAETLARARQSAALRNSRQQLRAQRAAQPAVTRDGCAVCVRANIGSPQDAAHAVCMGADGVGLFRSEFFYMSHSALPDEEAQYDGVCLAAQALGGRPLVVRTMDIGGDKKLACLPLAPEPNPSLGYRALRISLERPDLFYPQLRALLRAAARWPVSILLPMVSSVEEIRAALAAIERCKEALRREGVPFCESTPVGIMIEVPAIALQAEDAARLVDFFSIGTNDLLQYSLAVDRTNEKVAGLCQPFHPGVLRLIRHVIRAADGAHIPVGMCGEMAGMPAAIPLLLGMGLRQFSMNSAGIPQAKELLRALSAADCAGFAARALALPSAGEVRAAAEAFAAGEAQPPQP